MPEEEAPKMAGVENYDEHPGGLDTWARSGTMSTGGVAGSGEILANGQWKPPGTTKMRLLLQRCLLEPPEADYYAEGTLERLRMRDKLQFLDYDELFAIWMKQKEKQKVPAWARTIPVEGETDDEYDARCVENMTKIEAANHDYYMRKTFRTERGSKDCIDSGDALVCCALGFCYNAFVCHPEEKDAYIKGCRPFGEDGAAFPAGCATSSTLCMYLEHDCCCKTGIAPLRLFCCDCRFSGKDNWACVKVETQLCCCIQACALPPDQEVPCMLAGCCYVCYPFREEGDEASHVILLTVDHAAHRKDYLGNKITDDNSVGAHYSDKPNDAL